MAQFVVTDPGARKIQLILDLQEWFGLSVNDARNYSEGCPMTVGARTLTKAQKEHLRQMGVKFEIRSNKGAPISGIWEPRTWHERLLVE